MQPLETITVAEAADVMNIYPRLLRYGLQQGRFPFGFAVKLKNWSYVIYKDKFYEWVEEKVG
ncbi:MAG: hypothetical protein M0R40_00480 [Firmicutes bacterium]|nr:hypothetical protein [Bacillota bacterium]